MTRLERLRSLLHETGQAVADYDRDSEEDLRPYFEGAVALGKWCCVTRHGDKVFFLPSFDTAEEAKDRAVEFINDDIYDEIPVSVVNLDTGNRIIAELSANWINVGVNLRIPRKEQA